MIWKSTVPALLSLLFSHQALAAPGVQLGNTILTGRDKPLFKQTSLEVCIPYTESPKRLEPPVLRTNYVNGTMDASHFGSACLQLNLAASQVSEDCLSINVLRPSGINEDSALPVMFWTYGGGFHSGTVAQHNGSVFVQQSVARGTPVIYINFNYRLGPLGFPQGQEAADRGALNLGLKDQLVALEWVKKNVRAFGGDPNKVSFAFFDPKILDMNGEIGDGIWTQRRFYYDFNSILESEIFQSGLQPTSPIFPPQYREDDRAIFVGGVPECANLTSTESTFECLQNPNISSASIVQGMSISTDKNGIGQWAPVLDGPDGFLPDLPSRLYEQGSFARIPFIAGTQLDEGTSFIPPTGLNFTDATMRQFILVIYAPPLPPYTLADLSGVADKLVALYPDIPALGSPFGTGNETFGLDQGLKRFAAWFGDINFQSLRRLWIQTAANKGVPTYGYEFTQPQANSSYLGVSHSTLVRYVYGAPLNATPADIEISRVIVDYWISFATSLTPNDGKGISRPVWRQYKSHSDEASKVFAALIDES
ncbi:hypothetical protein VNI00_004797 [Paramarasmius palmivorus]|uniref:Carboxylesterase type B domain-containing protein n=1 Tax=Paramarasmius palmivorus TaxID=297713 RepID=A0AAW0DHY7_9AGAR